MNRSGVLAALLLSLLAGTRGAVATRLISTAGTRDPVAVARAEVAAMAESSTLEAARGQCALSRWMVGRKIVETPAAEVRRNQPAVPSRIGALLPIGGARFNSYPPLRVQASLERRDLHY
ncbi:hypothetical protein PR202_ga03522 [Eleusine coracana subsp. coracana]|uniref:Uncharacterized protein n=1 Tax=Eleusine coracana subsp. coracana TaxID=191504 RepID=A0AAV5BML0_ELECO|nr:hypothetical protein PR202_ga03522 [Eleusine coracana subsp. coracana]